MLIDRCNMKGLLKHCLGLSLCLILGLGLSTSVYAQVKRAKRYKTTQRAKLKILKGQVINLRTGLGIYRVAIHRGKVKEKPTTFTDGQGYFTLPAMLGDTLYVHCSGYQPTTVVVRDFKPLLIRLDDAVVEEEMDEIFCIEEPAVAVNSYATKYAAKEVLFSPSPLPLGAMPIEGQDEYKAIKENGFRSARHSPLSTFSTDVDVASSACMPTGAFRLGAG